MQRTEDGQAQVRYSVAGRSGGRVTSCVICTVHMEIRSTGFLVEPQNQGRWFPVLDLKIKLTTVYRLRHKTDGGRSVWDMCRDLVA
jgi:hypothetical protein